MIKLLYRFRDSISYSPKLKRSRGSERIPFGGIVYDVYASKLISVNLHTKFEVHRFSHSKNIIGTQNLKQVT